MPANVSRHFTTACGMPNESRITEIKRFDQRGWEIVIDTMISGFDPSKSKSLSPGMKELAAYLNLTPETLSRLKQKLG